MENTVQVTVVGDPSGDVLFHEPEAGVVREVTQIVSMAGHKIVHRHDAMPFAQKPIAQVRSQETGRTGNEDVHSVSRPIDA
ncbi:MAG: hypothetical protein NVS4B3_18360 [Gemmatimonadaceae bacterium]